MRGYFRNKRCGKILVTLVIVFLVQHFLTSVMTSDWQQPVLFHGTDKAPGGKQPYLASRHLEHRQLKREVFNKTLYQLYKEKGFERNVSVILATPELAAVYSMNETFWAKVYRQIEEEKRHLGNRKGDTLTGRRAEELYFKRRPEKLNVFKYGVDPNITTSCQPDVFLVIVVHSKPDYRRRRDAIRNTWGSLARGVTWPRQSLTGNVKLVFIVGKSLDDSLDTSIRRESDEYEDIIGGNFTDSYNNMTLKSLLGLKWVSEQCSSATYMLKSDDDMFVHVPQILALKQPIRSILGPYYPRSLAQRDGKWAVKIGVYPFRYYPPYETGSAYVITTDIVRELYETSEYVPQFHVDDVYVTGILGKIVGVNHLKRPAFAYFSEKTPSICDVIRPSQLTSTNVDPKLMYLVWAELRSGRSC